MNRTLLFIALVLLATPAVAHSPPSLRLLFIGNSLTYSNDLPGVVEALGAANGVAVTTQSKTKADFGLQDHWADKRTRAAVAAGGWDYVVMQQGPSSLPANQANLRKWTQRWAKPIRAGGAQPALLMVWPSTSRLRAFPAVDQAYSDAAVAAEAVLLPAGRAWWSAWQLQPGPALYSSDGFHPDPTGTLLAALVVYAGLTGVLPAELPGELPVGNSQLSIDDDLERVLLQAAATALASTPAVDPN